jgi:hypothetical protein
MTTTFWLTIVGIAVALSATGVPALAEKLLSGGPQ